jgi:hypothetical protein
LVAGVSGFVGEELVAELRVVAVGLEQRVGEVSLGSLAVADRPQEPAVVGLAGELEDPARHRDRGPISGELTDERVDRFPRRFACDN